MTNRKNRTVYSGQRVVFADLINWGGNSEFIKWWALMLLVGGNNIFFSRLPAASMQGKKTKCSQQLEITNYRMKKS